MADELLPCRFCGGIPVLIRAYETDCGYMHFFQLIEYCRQNYKPRFSQITKYWNKRNKKNSPFIEDKANGVS